MIGNMFKNIFVIDKSISITFELIKLGFSGSDQMLLNTISMIRVVPVFVSTYETMKRAQNRFCFYLKKCSNEGSIR